jgi:hypothetical protein
MNIRYPCQTQEDYFHPSYDICLVFVSCQGSYHLFVSSTTAGKECRSFPYQGISSFSRGLIKQSLSVS